MHSYPGSWAMNTSWALAHCEPFESSQSHVRPSTATPGPRTIANIWAPPVLGYLPSIIPVVLLRSPALTWPEFGPLHSHLTSHVSMRASRLSGYHITHVGPDSDPWNCIPFSLDATFVSSIEITSLNLWTFFLTCSLQGPWFILDLSRLGNMTLMMSWAVHRFDVIQWPDYT